MRATDENDSELFLFFLVSLRETEQSVCSFIGFALTIIDPKVISREILGLPDLTRVPAFVSMSRRRLLWLVRTGASCLQPFR